MKVSIIVPVYNEIQVIEESIKRIRSSCSGWAQLIVVDDGSNDGTYSYLRSYRREYPFTLIRNKENKGKGHCIKLGLKKVTGDIVIIQDADMEYSPSEWVSLIKPIEAGVADVVYGSRFKGSGAKRVIYFKNYLANKFLTFVSNVLTGLNLSDIETGAKVFRTDVLKSIELKENGFGFEPEVTAKLKKHRFYEVGISYRGRTYEEGKKIRMRDGFISLYCILKYNLWR